MAGIINCSYARVAAKHSLLKESGKVEYDQKERYHKFNRVFEGKYDANFYLEYEIYRVKSKDIASTFNKWKNNDHKKGLLKAFLCFKLEVTSTNTEAAAHSKRL